ncbi:MAG: hypothetical protein ACR2NP_05260 [Pirellulaceae bacterium]
MRWAVSMTVCAAAMVCGCQAFNNPQVANSNVADERASAYRDRAPAQRRRPRTLDYLPGVSEASPDHPLNSPHASASSGGLGIEQAGLDSERVQIEGDISIDEVTAQDQLPAIMESVENPLSTHAPTFTVSDQPAGVSAVPNEIPMDGQPQQNTGPIVMTISDTEGQQMAYDEDSSDSLRLTVQSEVEPVARIPASVNELFVDEPLPAGPITGQATRTHPPVQPALFEQQEAATPGDQPVTSVADTQSQTADDLLQTQPQPLTWQEQLAATIHQLDAQIQNTPESASSEQRVRLQLLRLAAGKELEPMDATPGKPSQKQFWNHQLTVIDTMLNQSGPDSRSISATAAWRRRATQAARQLKLALDELANVASLQLEHVAFCSEVRGFGQYQPLPPRFHVGQQVLIYCEIDNYSLQSAGTTETDQQLVAKLQGRYAIVDAENRVVYQYEFQPVEDTAQRRRKDFYMFFPVAMPELPIGEYRLQLSVEDLVGNKVASGGKDLAFQIQAAPVNSGARPPQTAAAPPTRQQR